MRYDVIAALRGFALFGVLWVNTTGHALSHFAINDPTAGGGMDALNFGAWLGTSVFIEGCMRGLFSLLFGASVILITRRAAAPEDSLLGGDLYFRRNLWLMVFGLVHGFLLLMPGDILYTYALCGMVLFVFRLASVRTLLALSCLCLVIVSAVEGMDAAEKHQIADQLAAYEDISSAPEEIQDLAGALKVPQEYIDTEYREKVTSPYSVHVRYFAPVYADTIFSASFVFELLDALTMMLIGMAMMKSGVLSGERRLGFYLRAGLTLAAIGFACRGYDIFVRINNDFVRLDAAAASAREIGRVALAVAYANLFIALWKLGAMRWIATGLSAFGRMAFTNYIGGTVLAVLIFYGTGFGLYATLSRIEVYGVVLVMAALQIAVSALWLSRYRYGPLEWTWRSLTQLKRMPLQHQTAGS